MGAGGIGLRGAGGIGGVDRRYYSGIDRGFIFFENSPGIPWRGLIEVEELEDAFRLESYYIDGQKVGQSLYSGNYSATVQSYDNPLTDVVLKDSIFGFSYREHYNFDGENFYKIHIVQGITIENQGHSTETVNATSKPTTFSWGFSTVDVDLGDNIFGSHLILDSATIYEWLMRDIENILYGSYEDSRIPSLEDLYEIFATMNLVIIDHGDGTWSAVGHETMIRMLDVTEFEIETPSAEYITDDTYDIESLIREERWVDQTESENVSWMPPAEDPFKEPEEDFPLEEYE